MRALLILCLTVLCLLPTARAQSWSIEYSIGLPAKQRGDLAVTLTPGARINHAFLDRYESFFPGRIPGNARVELVYTITEAPGTVWDANPGRQTVPGMDLDAAPPRIGLTLQRDWSTAGGRWYSIPRHDLQPGTYRLIVPVDGYAWKNVIGKIGNESAKQKESFRRTWGEPARIGLCFGGFFHAHGIAVTQGAATIRVLSLRVRPRRVRRARGRRSEIRSRQRWRIAIDTAARPYESNPVQTLCR